jgi:hypothetical protein
MSVYLVERTTVNPFPIVSIIHLPKVHWQLPATPRNSQKRCGVSKTIGSTRPGQPTTSIIHTFFLRYCGLNLGPSPWANLPALFLWAVFRDRVSQNFLPRLGWTAILLISASWVARIIGVNHWHQAMKRAFFFFLQYWGLNSGLHA